MIEVRQTSIFSAWFEGLRDIRARAQIIRRIERAQAGNLGDVAPIGEGLSVMRGNELVILLCGGDKGSQKSDIRDAREIAKELD